MTVRGCGIPLVVRLRGVPNEDRLAEMSEAIARGIAGRLSEAARVIARTEGWDSYRATHAPPVIRFSGGSLDSTVRHRVAAAIEAGITRAVASGYGTGTGPASSRPGSSRSETGSAAARPLHDPQQTETDWTLNGVHVFSIRPPDRDAPSGPPDFQPLLSTNNDGSSRLRITVFRDANVAVQLQPDAVARLTHLASEIEIQEIVTVAPPQDGPLRPGAPSPGAAPGPAAVPQRVDAARSRPTQEEFQPADDAPLPAPTHLDSVAVPLPPLLRSGSETIVPATPPPALGESGERGATKRDVLSDLPPRIDLPGHDLPGDNQPQPFVEVSEGGKLVDGPFNEPGNDGAFEEGQRHIDKIIVFETKMLLTDDEFAAGVERARGPDGIILPYRRTGPEGSETSPIPVSRLPGGRLLVHLHSDISATDYAADPDIRLPPDIGKGVELNATDVVGVKFFDEGVVSFFPALMLMHLGSEATRAALVKAGEAFAGRLTVAADSAADGKAETDATEQRASGLAGTDRVFFDLDAATRRIEQYRAWIIETWPDEGRAFMSSIEQLNAFAGSHGLAKGDPTLTHVVNGLRRSYQELRGKADDLDLRLSADERDQIEQINRDTEQLLSAIEEKAARDG